MQNRPRNRHIAAALVWVSFTAFVLIVFFVSARIAAFQRELSTAILSGLAESLSDEQTARSLIVSQMLSDAELEALLSDHEAVKIALNSEDRIGILVLLGEAGPDAAPFVPELIDNLDNQNPEVRRQAAYALGEIGSDAAPALELLRSMSKDEHDRVQPEATKAIEKIVNLGDERN